MADADDLKAITDALEATYQALRQSAANISGLLQLGVATCDEVKAYNLWALAIYNTQIGMLDALRAGGESGIPDAPAAPTLFVWNGVSGSDAWSIDCSGQAQSLSGAMKKALKGPTPTTKYLSTNEIKIVTQDQYAFNPSAAPTFANLLAVQQARAQPQNLGVVGVLIVIAAIVISVSVAIAAIMSYLKTNSVEKSNTAQVQAQATAFANFTAARLQCQANCGNTADCAAQCAKLITAPTIKLPGQLDSWGWLQWTGFVVVLGGGLIIAGKLYKRHKEGKPLIELPESVEHAINPPAHAA